MPEFLNVGLFHRNDVASRVERPNAVGRDITSTQRHGRPDQRDQVELSEHAQHLAGLRNMSPIRSEKVQAAQALIASGGYDTSEFLSIAIERLIQEELA
jgi:hypothetical protein